MICPECNEVIEGEGRLLAPTPEEEPPEICVCGASTQGWYHASWCPVMRVTA